jgi:peptidoglycan/xylan/chitin deacetylase (PgdA/CDA1 family)
MAALRKRYSVVDPEEMCELIANPGKLRHPRVGITFDDGYRDNYVHAFPILKAHGHKAMFFLPTHYVGEKHLTWWDQIGWAVRHSKRSEITLRYPRTVTIKIDHAEPTAAIRKVLHLLTKDSTVDRKRFMAEVEEACGVTMPTEADERQFLSWEEAAEMERAGMAMGSHTHSHEILASLSAGEQREQCKRSRDLLVEKKLKADCLAYPVGHHDSYSDTTIEAAKEAGYRFAFTNFGGINTPDDIHPFHVRRLGMDLGDTLPYFRLRLALSNVTGRQV